MNCFAERYNITQRAERADSLKVFDLYSEIWADMQSISVEYAIHFSLPVMLFVGQKIMASMVPDMEQEQAHCRHMDQMYNQEENVLVYLGSFLGVEGQKQSA